MDLERLRRRWTEKSAETKALPTRQISEHTEVPIDPWGEAGLMELIEKTRQTHWPQIEHSSTEVERKERISTYLAALTALEVDTLTEAEKQGRDTLPIKTFFGTEKIRSWTLLHPGYRDPKSQQQHLASAEWQHNVLRHLLQLSSDAKLAGFWRSYHRILMPQENSTALSDQTRLAAAERIYRAGIVSAFVLSRALQQPGWEVMPPPDAHDDVDNKIDLIVKTPEGIIFLVQLKTMDKDASEDIVIQKVSLTAGTRDPEIYKFQNGVQAYLRRPENRHLNAIPIFAKINSHPPHIHAGIGTPTPQFAQAIQGEFVRLLTKYTKGAKNSEPSSSFAH